MTKTFDIPCSIEQVKGTTQKETIVCPSFSPEETVASANLYFRAPDRKGPGHYSISVGRGVFVAGSEGKGLYRAEVSGAFVPRGVASDTRLEVSWVPYGGKADEEPLALSDARLSVRSASDLPFTPIGTLSTSDGSSLSAGALDGREVYAKPLFRNVFDYPVVLYYDSAIAGNASHLCLPFGLRLSFLETFDGTTYVRGDGERVGFLASPDNPSVLYDPRGTGLYAEQVGGLWRIVDAFSGGFLEFSASGYLSRAVDGYGTVLLTATRSMIGATATDRLGNQISLSTNKLSLNSDDYSASFTRSSSRPATMTYRHGPGDPGETTSFTCTSSGMTRVAEPSGEVLAASFLSGAVSSISKGVIQENSLVAEETLSFGYGDSRATASNMLGRAVELSFDADGRPVTREDDSGRLRTVLPPGTDLSVDFGSARYLRRMGGAYPVAMYGATGDISIGQEQVPVLAGSMMKAGARHCVIATVDFSASAVPDASAGRVFRVSPQFTYGSGLTLTLDFAHGSGAVRTLYGFVDPTVDAGLLSVAVEFSGMPGTATITALCVVACGASDFCYQAASGPIGPHFSSNWKARNASNSYGRKYSSGFEDGAITRRDAEANALLSLRSKNLLFCDGLTKLRSGDFGYGTSFPKTSPSAATVGFHLRTDAGEASFLRLLPGSGALELGTSLYDRDAERTSRAVEDAHGQALSSLSPTGGSRKTLDAQGRVTAVTEVSSASADGDSTSFGYAGTDGRVSSVSDDWADVSYQYAGSTLNVGQVGSASAGWGGAESYSHSPRGEWVSSFSKGSSSVSSATVGAHRTSLAQGVGSVGLAYGLGGLTLAQGSDSSALETRSASFSPSSVWRKRTFGANGGLRLVLTPFSRPSALYLVPASGSEAPAATWTYGFGDSDGESAASPVRTVADHLIGATDTHDFTVPGTASVTRVCPSNPAFGFASTRQWDGRGRTTAMSSTLTGLSISHSQTYSYVAGTSSPSSTAGTLTYGGSYDYGFDAGTTLDDFGRPCVAVHHFDGKGVERHASYTHGMPTSLATYATASGTTSTSAETLSYDAGRRVASLSSTESGTTRTNRYQRDAEGRIVREDNAALGHTFLYSYDASGNLSLVKRGAYTSSPTPSASDWRAFSYSPSWGPLLTSAHGAAASHSNGYPTSLLGLSLSWAHGRLTQFGSSLFAYDAFGNLIARSGGRSSTFVYDGFGRLIEEVSSSYYIAFVHGISGPIGFRVLSGPATGNYAYRFDALGNVDAIVGSNGVVARYAYDAFGNGRVMDSSWAENTSPSFVGNINPIRYKGGLYDKETGLYKFGSRWYCPAIYRWLSPDDASYLEPDAIGGANPYIYCYNDPVTYVDPKGHSAIVALLIAAGIGALAGLAGQLTADVVHGFTTGNWEFSWQQYLGAGLGGAIGGVLYALGVGGFATGFVSAAFATLVGDGLEMLTGDRNANWSILAVDTLASGLIGGIGGAVVNIGGINRGSHSLHQIYKSGLTKVWHYGWRMSVKTMAKGFAMTYITDYASILYSAAYSWAEDNGYLIW